MSTDIDPIVGNWYKAEGENSFEVIAVDDDTIEVQYFDGGVEEFDRATWGEMGIEAIEPPEDWSGPFDDLEKDDLGYTDTEGDENDLSHKDKGL
jgi:Family of unknown function (DUF6763)